MGHVLCVVLLIAAVSVDIDADQPIFQGKPIGHWVEKLSDPDPNVRNLAAYVLGEIGSGAKQAVPALMEAYGNGRSDLRLSVIEALGSIGPEARRWPMRKSGPTRPRRSSRSPPTPLASWPKRPARWTA